MLSNAMSIQQYKNIFDANNYKKDSYEMAKFITFLMNSSIGNKEIEELTGLKKSQVFSYKKVIKKNKTEELRTTAFRKVLKSCEENEKPKVEKDLVQAIESEASPPKPLEGTFAYYEGPHFFRESELSPGRSTFSNNDFCPCELPTNSAPRGGNFVHIPEFQIARGTYLSLQEVFDYEQQIHELKGRVEKLELENSALRSKSVKRTSV